MATIDKLSSQARDLVGRLSQGCQDPEGFGHFSSSLYDVAWLSMIEKKNADGSKLVLFPQCFELVLQSQGQDGQWPGYASPIDSLLNNLACILALQKHSKHTDSKSEPLLNLFDRIARATTMIQDLLNKWDIESTRHVGFEVLVPALLGMLERNGTIFDFPGKARLMDLYKSKMSKIHPSYISSPKQTTILHSLEGLIGYVNFDELRHHCTKYGGMLGSPASTAAYLMHCSNWDRNAEIYLRTVLRRYGNKGHVPSGWPSPVFEASWVLSTLINHGYNAAELGTDNVNRICQYLAKTVDEQSGIVGFAPGFLPDADDTSKALLTLELNKYPASPESLVMHFFQATHFKTYEMERNPSFSANCNVLLSLLACPTAKQYIKEIETALHFLYDLWDKDGAQDKWNLRAEYSEMLFGEVFTRAIHLHSISELELNDELVLKKLPMLLCQLATRAVAQQLPNGGWADSCEVSAYRVLLLSHILQLPWPKSIRAYLQASLAKGKTYLQARKQEWTNAEYLWIEKVTYKSTILAEAYCLAAARSSPSSISWNVDIRELFALDEASQGQILHLVQNLPLVSGIPAATIQVILIEAQIFSRKLGQSRLDVFPRDDMDITKDKYLRFIPVLWLLANYQTGFALSNQVMWQMMVVSMLNFQADEYMESVVSQLSEPCLKVLQIVIEAECKAIGRSSRTSTQISGIKTRGSASPPPLQPLTPPHADPGTEFKRSAVPLQLSVQVLQSFIQWVKRQPVLLHLPENIQQALFIELQKFLEAHISHNLDNKSFQAKQFSDTSKPQLNVNLEPSKHYNDPPYFDWVRSTGAYDTSCPYSFVFFCCLIAEKGNYCLSSPRSRYIGQSLAVHLATMCRQYNDLGSQKRDIKEGNLNSLNFPEFKQSALVDGSGKEARQALMSIAEFERESMEHAFQQLTTNMSTEVTGAIRAFVNVTDLFGQLYVAKDIASQHTK